MRERERERESEQNEIRYSYLQAIPSCSLELVALDIKLHGGEVTDCFTEDVTHIVFHKRYLCLIVVTIADTEFYAQNGTIIYIYIYTVETGC